MDARMRDGGLMGERGGGGGVWGVVGGETGVFWVVGGREHVGVKVVDDCGRDWIGGVRGEMRRRGVAGKRGDSGMADGVAAVIEVKLVGGKMGKRA